MNETTRTDELLEFFKALADASRLKIIGVLAISEGYTTPIVPLPYADGRLAAESVAVPVATGELQVNLQVNVTYEIE